MSGQQREDQGGRGGGEATNTLGSKREAPAPALIPCQCLGPSWRQMEERLREAARAGSPRQAGLPESKAGLRAEASCHLPSQLMPVSCFWSLLGPWKGRRSLHRRRQSLRNWTLPRRPR